VGFGGFRSREALYLLAVEKWAGSVFGVVCVVFQRKKTSCAIFCPDLRPIRQPGSPLR
jgi:hypothetical protein